MTWRPTLWLVAFVVVAVDQTTKQVALHLLEPGQNVPLLGKWLSLELVFNSGAAFSLGDRFTWVLTIVVVILTVGIISYARRARRTAAVWVFGVGLGGALGNLIDRLARDPGFGRGHVIDMINYNNWFVGNIADVAIVGAACVAVLMALRGKEVLAPSSDAAPSGPDAPVVTPGG